MNEELAWYILHRQGYNYALSDVEEACAYLDHPELMEKDTQNYHEWAAPYPVRCYCGAIGYTDRGRFNAIELSESHLKVLQGIFPDFVDNYGKLYVRKTDDDEE
jgi:hypothetical protein